MTARRLILAPRARRDLDDIAAYTEHEWDLARRNAYLSNLIGTLDHLRISPDLGQNRDDIRPGLHSFPSGKHIIFYRHSNGKMEAIRILHQAMEQENHF